ncbi:hypothetical protein [Fodinibius sp.]|uniref:hypothetical protein n=1 Tax=Fodinibius sp. TaxID=1872440 RepID=UPI002ACEF476|nr:hypothetical protein [Fodinibius sp.]MDZ7659510.1 hypothetical protein [Fodinibius sp.]
MEQELERRSDQEGVRFQIKDRQIENMAALITVDLFVCRPSDVQFAELVEQSAQEKAKVNEPDLHQMQNLIKESRD